jgi:hypothetical protein
VLTAHVVRLLTERMARPPAPVARGLFGLPKRAR